MQYTLEKNFALLRLNEEVWFHLIGRHINFQNNRFPTLIDQMP